MSPFCVPVRSFLRSFLRSRLRRRRWTRDDAHAAILRLLPQPLYRYRSPPTKFDGAVFALVGDHATDSEILVRIEAAQHEGDADTKPIWHYQLVRSI